MPKKSGARRIAFLSMLTALGVVILYVASFIEVLDMSAAVLASLICAIAVIEYGKAAPWLLWGATSALSIILLPNKLGALMYAAFFGIYPVLKEKIERGIARKLWQWVCKVVLFNVAIFVIIMLTKWVVGIENEPLILEIAYFLLANFTLVLYDIAMTRMITFYIVKLRKRFGFK